MYSKKSEVNEALTETKRLLIFDDHQIRPLGELVTTLKLPVKNGLVASATLYDLLVIFDTPSVFLLEGNGIKSVNGHLYQFLIVHFTLAEERQPFLNTAELCAYLRQNEALRQPFIHWADRSKFIIYLENTGLQTWRHFAENFDGDLPGMHLLSGSLPYCNAGLDAIFRFIKDVKSKNPEQSAYRFMAPDFLLKLELDTSLRAEILKRADEILNEPVVREMMPVLLKGAINGDEQVFATQLAELTEKLGQTMLADLLFALAVACPDTPYCLSLFKQHINEKRDAQLLRPAEYLNIINVKNYASPEVIIYIEGSSLSGDVHELGFIITYLSNNVADRFKEPWFVRVAGNVIKSPAPELIHRLNNLLTLLVENDPLLVYQLLTLRFSLMAETSFLDEPWYGLMTAGAALFENRLTLWFIHGNSNVHRTLLHLCTADLVSAGQFRLSQELLASLDMYQKIYIAYKITGYIYSKEYLESALFSLAESATEDEDVLLEELYKIFNDYLIYNYRSTLKTIKSLISQGGLPAHLLLMYNKLIASYDKYFKEMDQVKPLIELQPDPELLQHSRFFRQQQMASQLEIMMNETTPFRRKLTHCFGAN